MVFNRRSPNMIFPNKCSGIRRMKVQSEYSLASYFRILRAISLVTSISWSILCLKQLDISMKSSISKIDTKTNERAKTKNIKKMILTFLKS